MCGFHTLDSFFRNRNSVFSNPLTCAATLYTQLLFDSLTKDSQLADTAMISDPAKFAVIASDFPSHLVLPSFSNGRLVLNQISLKF